MKRVKLTSGQYQLWDGGTHVANLVHDHLSQEKGYSGHQWTATMHGGQGGRFRTMRSAETWIRDQLRQAPPTSYSSVTPNEATPEEENHE